MSSVLNTASAAGLLCAALLLPAAQAQGPARAPAANAPAAPASAPAAAYEGGGGEQAPAAWAPVLVVTGVEVLRSARPSELDIVRVSGVSGTDGWTSPQLVPITRAPAGDGMLELLLVAQAPNEAQGPTGFSPLEAVFIIDAGHPYKGVRVRGASNSVSLARLPGYAQAAPPANDCSRCVGKLFVAKGAAPPSGAAPADLVLEKDLPSTLRVIRPADGIAKLDADPNRLTLVLGDDGRVSIAVWD